MGFYRDNSSCKRPQEVTWSLIKSSVLLSLIKARVTLLAEIDITRHRFPVKAEFLILKNDIGVLSKHSG